MAQVVIGNGSNDVLELVAHTFLSPGTSAVYSKHAFAVYPLSVKAIGATSLETPARDFGHDPDAMVAAIRDDTRILFIANPNNPTGTFLSGDTLGKLLARVPRRVVVVLDEAYTDYLPDSVRYDSIAWLRDHPNLVITRTFSKAYGLAGLRAGYALGPESLMSAIRAVAPPFGLSAVAEAAALAALGDPEHTTRIVESVKTGREAFRKRLCELGLNVPQSQSNFVFLPVGAQALDLEKACTARGVAVRAFAGDGVRVTVGYPEAEAAVLEAVESVFLAHHSTTARASISTSSSG
jgi:histidinol-phosphate aminotransferase